MRERNGSIGAEFFQDYAKPQKNFKHMKNPLFRLGLLLFGLGFIGVLSLLTMELNLPEGMLPAEMPFTKEQLKYLSLINPTILLVIFTLIGTVLYQRSGFELPVFERLVGMTNKPPNLRSIGVFGVAGGILAGLSIVVITWAFESSLPAQLTELSERMQPTLANRFLYGGITEEILMRYGLMTFLVFLAHLVLDKSAGTFWFGILVSSLLFGLGHLPVVFLTGVELNTTLLIYILAGNGIGGILFGWLYWKKGLAAAMIAHVFAHVVMVLMG